MTGRLRALLHNMAGVKVGRKCTFQHRVEFIHGWQVRFGKECIVDAYAEFKCPTTVDPSVNYNIDIADNVFIGRGTIIDANRSIRIGENTFIAPYCHITDSSHSFADSNLPIRLQGCEYKPIVIGADVWIGAHVVILAGITIGNGCVVGANSTVTKNVPPGAVIAGSPARIIKYRAGSNETT